jgi:hypothetical protein
VTNVLDDRARVIQAELARLDGEVERLATAIAAGGELTALFPLLLAYFRDIGF